MTDRTDRWEQKDVDDLMARRPDLAKANKPAPDLTGSLPRPIKKQKGTRRHPEKQLEQFVHDACKSLGLLYYHTYRSRFSEPGFPDCIILGDEMLVVELKATGKEPTPIQAIWLGTFMELGIAVRVWHPEDKDEILKTLADMRNFTA